MIFIHYGSSICLFVDMIENVFFSAKEMTYLKILSVPAY